MADLFYMVLFAWIAVNVMAVGIAIVGGLNRREIMTILRTERGQGRSST